MDIAVSYKSLSAVKFSVTSGKIFNWYSTLYSIIQRNIVCAAEETEKLK